MTTNLNKIQNQDPSYFLRVSYPKMLGVLVNVIFGNMFVLLVITRHHAGVLTSYSGRIMFLSLPDLPKYCFIVLYRVMFVMFYLCIYLLCCVFYVCVVLLMLCCFCCFLYSFLLLSLPDLPILRGPSNQLVNPNC